MIGDEIMDKQIKLPFNVTKANEATVEILIKLGFLYVDETGLHAIEK